VVAATLGLATAIAGLEIYFTPRSFIYAVKAILIGLVGQIKQKILSSSKKILRGLVGMVELIKRKKLTSELYLLFVITIIALLTQALAMNSAIVKFIVLSVTTIIALLAQVYAMDSAIVKLI
jgi:hypothetical protein